MWRIKTEWYCVGFKKHWAELFSLPCLHSVLYCKLETLQHHQSTACFCSLVFVKHIKLHFQQSCWPSHWELPLFSFISSSFSGFLFHYLSLFISGGKSAHCFVSQLISHRNQLWDKAVSSDRRNKRIRKIRMCVTKVFSILYWIPKKWPLLHDR